MSTDKEIQENFEILRKIQKKPHSTQRQMAEELGVSLGKIKLLLKSSERKRVNKD